jgi:hypothetical protein
MFDRLTHRLTRIHGPNVPSSVFMLVKVWRREWDSNPHANVNSATCKATDGSFSYEKQCKAVLTDCEWIVIVLALLPIFLAKLTPSVVFVLALIARLYSKYSAQLQSGWPHARRRF